MTDSSEIPDCVFCRIVTGHEPAKVIKPWLMTLPSMIIEPLNPVTPGHVLVIPYEHVPDFTTDPEVSAKVMTTASAYATPPCNLITSAGEDATQTVFHLHLHVIPRREGDSLMLPWSPLEEMIV